MPGNSPAGRNCNQGGDGKQGNQHQSPGVVALAEFQLNINRTDQNPQGGSSDREYPEADDARLQSGIEPGNSVSKAQAYFFCAQDNGHRHNQHDYEDYPIGERKGPVPAWTADDTSPPRLAAQIKIPK